MSCYDDAMTFKQFVERESNFEFFAGFNNDLNQIQVQILNK